MWECLLQDPDAQQALRDLRNLDLLKTYAEGVMRSRVLGARWALHRVLAARSLPVTDDVRARIDRESDLARLESWLDAAATASTSDEVFPPAERARSRRSRRREQVVERPAKRRVRRAPGHGR
jgi:hypothetical protein